MKALIILLALVVVLPVSCGDDDGVAPATGASMEELKIVRPGVDLTAEVEVGDRLMVLLESNPSTGFSWNLESDPECLRLLSDPEWVARSGLVGGAGDLVFTFEAVDSGTELLSFAYRRPWETTSPLSVESLDVIVH